MSVKWCVGKSAFESDNLYDLPWDAQSNLGRMLDSGVAFSDLPETMRHFYALRRYVGNINGNGHATTFGNWSGSSSLWLRRAEAAADFFELEAYKAAAGAAAEFVEANPELNTGLRDAADFHDDIRDLDQGFVRAERGLEQAVPRFEASADIEARIRDLSSHRPNHFDLWAQRIIRAYPGLKVSEDIDTDLERESDKLETSEARSFRKSYLRFHHSLPNWLGFLLLQTIGDTGPVLRQRWNRVGMDAISTKIDIFVDFEDHLALMRAEDGMLKIWRRTGDKTPMPVPDLVTEWRSVPTKIPFIKRRKRFSNEGMRQMSLNFNSRADVARRHELMAETPLSCLPAALGVAARLNFNAALHLLFYSSDETPELTAYQLRNWTSEPLRMTWFLRSYEHHFDFEIDATGATLRNRKNGRSRRVNAAEICAHAELLQAGMVHASTYWDAGKDCLAIRA